MKLADDSKCLMEWYGWQNCGGEYWDHPDYPMQQFHAEDALKLAREQCKIYLESYRDV